MQANLQRECGLPIPGTDSCGVSLRIGDFEERDGSTFVECRAISLTRDVPKPLAWLIEPIILKLPRESLKATLDSTRRALA